MKQAILTSSIILELLFILGLIICVIFLAIPIPISINQIKLILVLIISFIINTATLLILHFFK